MLTYDKIPLNCDFNNCHDCPKNNNCYLTQDIGENLKEVKIAINSKLHQIAIYELDINYYYQIKKRIDNNEFLGLTNIFDKPIITPKDYSYNLDLYELEENIELLRNEIRQLRKKERELE